jgi:hypothetical protein
MMNVSAAPSWRTCDKGTGEVRRVNALHRLIARLAVALIVFGTHPAPAHDSAAYPEEAVKAVFLYRFAGYVSWPASTENTAQFTIAVLGAANVAEQLNGFLPGHPIHSRPARVMAIQGLGQLGDAQMLYIGPGVPGKLSGLIEALKNRPILIVTDKPGALEEGSTVNFLIEEQHVRFEISTAAAKRSGLQIGSGLLAVAEHIKTGDLRGRSICRLFGESNAPCPMQLAVQLGRPRSGEGG